MLIMNARGIAGLHAKWKNLESLRVSWASEPMVGAALRSRPLFEALVTGLSYYVGQEALLIRRTKTRCHHPLRMHSVLF